jgi:DNA-binding transcriptional LysR family regulator
LPDAGVRSSAHRLCKNAQVNWDDLRYFLELARSRRLARAGRKLGVDHTTVGRRIELLERALGCRLFEAGSDGYALTDAGHQLLAHAETIENSVDLMQTEARGQGVRVTGTVRIGTPEGFAAVFLVPRLTRLFALHPELNVELLTLPRFPSLAAREADILVTLDPPETGRYIAARLTEFSYGLFASRPYLSRYGAIRTGSDLARHSLVGYMDELRPSRRLDFLNDLSPGHRVQLSTSGMLAQLAAVRAGLSVGILAHYMARGTGLVAVLPREAFWKHTFWLATHADWYRLSRVRAVWDFVREVVEAEPDFFLPSRSSKASGNH